MSLHGAQLVSTCPAQASGLAGAPAGQAVTGKGADSQGGGIFREDGPGSWSEGMKTGRVELGDYGISRNWYSPFTAGKLPQGTAELAYGHLQGSNKSEREHLYLLSNHSVPFAAGCPKSVLLGRRNGLRGAQGLTAALSTAVPDARLLRLPSCPLNLAGRNPAAGRREQKAPSLVVWR